MASKNTVAWYIFDWLIIIAAAVIALAISKVNPDFHMFSLLDLSISYPHRPAKVNLGLFIFIAIIFPIVTIVFVSLYFPADSNPLSSGTPLLPRDSLGRDQMWRRKLWEMNAGLLGIGVSLSTATIVFTGIKNLTGKPRPDFLDRCLPDVANMAIYTVRARFGQNFSSLWVLVNQEICQQPDKWWLNEGFRSFPSGYATIAFAGLWYLSLYLSFKSNVVVPCSSSNRGDRPHGQQVDEVSEEPLLQSGEERANVDQEPTHTYERETVEKEMASAVAPPVILLTLPYIPLGLAIFLAGTRYFDFRNHGFDVLAGSVVGTVTAWFGFRLYHPSLLSHERVAWRP